MKTFTVTNCQQPVNYTIITYMPQNYLLCGNGLGTKSPGDLDYKILFLTVYLLFGFSRRTGFQIISNVTFKKW